MRLLGIIWGVLTLKVGTIQKVARCQIPVFFPLIFVLFPPFLVVFIIYKQYLGYLPMIGIIVPFLPIFYIFSFLYFISQISGRFFNHIINLRQLMSLVALVQLAEWVRNGFIIAAFYNLNTGFALIIGMFSFITVIITLAYAYIFVSREFGLGDQDTLVVLALSGIIMLIIRFIIEKMFLTGLVEKVLPVI